MKIRKTYKNLDCFLKDQLIIGFFIQSIWTLITPIIYKLQGTLWTTAYISFYLIMMRISGLIVPYFKGAHIKVVYRNMVILNSIYFVSVYLYFINKNIFLLTESILSVFFTINSILLGIAWDLHVVKKYPIQTYENYKYLATFRDSLGGITGYSLVILMGFILDESQSVKTFSFMMVFVLMLGIYNYNKHYKKF